MLLPSHMRPKKKKDRNVRVLKSPSIYILSSSLFLSAKPSKMRREKSKIKKSFQRGYTLKERRYILSNRAPATVEAASMICTTLLWRKE